MAPSERRTPSTDVSQSLFDVRLAALLEAAPDALVCVEPSGRIAQLNQRVGALLGYDRDELLGAEVEMLLPHALRARHAGHRAGFNAHPRVRSMGSGLALVAQHRDGSEIPVEVSLVPWLAGEPGWVIAAIRDVTGQRALEAASAENEARLRQIAESVDMVFILLQLEPSAILYASPQAPAMIGLDRPASTDDDLSLLLSLVHPDDRPAVELGFLVDAQRGLPATSEHRLIRNDQVVWVRVVATPVRVPQGPPRRTVITMEDVTARVMVAEALRDAEAAARAANDSKNQFLSRMSHELRTPLNAVLGFGQLLDRQLVGTEHAEAVSYVLKGGRHLLALINDVLDISRIESGQMSLSIEPIHLAALVDETLQLMAPLATSAQVTLLPGAGASDVLVLADRQRVRQILLNVLSNAVKYNKEGGHVWVSWVLDGDVVRLSVRDEGPGIAPELQSRLFHPFDRLGAESTTVEGAGIGLALTRSLAELMGGSVGVSSAPGQGATFTVTLRARRWHETPGTPAAGPAVGSGVAIAARAVEHPGTATLLYVEDNEPNVHVVEHLLALRPGWSMIHAPLGVMGVELARAHHPDLVLLDLHLPDQSGGEVLLGLKRRDDTKDIPVVILSADASPGLAARLVNAGADRFITKPLDVEVMLALLDEVSAGVTHDDADADADADAGSRDD